MVVVVGGDSGSGIVVDLPVFAVHHDCPAIMATTMSMIVIAIVLVIMITMVVVVVFVLVVVTIGL